MSSEESAAPVRPRWVQLKKSLRLGKPPGRWLFWDILIAGDNQISVQIEKFISIEKNPAIGGQTVLLHKAEAKIDILSGRRATEG